MTGSFPALCPDREVFGLLQIAFIAEGTELLAQIAEADREAVLSILLAYTMRTGAPVLH